MRAMAVADWFVDKASGALGARVSRRGFIAKTTLVGTAVAASGCAVVTQPGPPFQRITDCGGGALCRDGYTEFCCVINKGVNACPPGSIASGWWRADYSVYCNGTRFYIDCNDFSGYAPCGCAAGCGTRKVYCNHFRYGQCNQWIGGTGVIACRMVTCVPPYALNIGCGLSGAVDNATAGHNANCAAYAPPPPPPPPPLIATPLAPMLGGAVSLAAGTVSLFARGSDGAVWQQDYNGSAWGSWTSLGGTAKSAVIASVPAPGEIELSVRADDKSGAVQRFSAATWGGWESLGGLLTSDLAAATRSGVLHVVGRGTDRAIYTRRWNGSRVVAVGVPRRAADDRPHPHVVPEPPLLPRAWHRRRDLPERLQRLVVRLEPTRRLRHVVGGVRGDSDGPARLHPGPRHRLLHAAQRGERVHQLAADRRRSASTGIRSRWPTAADVSLFGRATSGGILCHARSSGSTWGAWESLDLQVKSDATAVSDGTGLWVFVQGTDDLVHYRRLQSGVWSAWDVLSGLTVAPVRGFP